MSDIEPYMLRIYYNGIVANVHDENLKDGTIIQDDDGDWEILQLFNVTDLDGGWYTCVAMNLAIGYASAYS